MAQMHDQGPEHTDQKANKNSAVVNSYKRSKDGVFVGSRNTNTPKKKGSSRGVPFKK